MPKTFSGKQVVKVLCRDFGFCFVSQKGSHIKLSKKEGARKITTIIPQYKELAAGTLKGILKLAQIEESAFQKKQSEIKTVWDSKNKKAASGGFFVFVASSQHNFSKIT